MNFINHSNLEGKHALLGASKWQWLNDNNETLMKRIRGSYSQEIGTTLHEFAAKRIKYRCKLSKAEKKSAMIELRENYIPESVIDMLDFDFVYNNLCNYVNDAIGYSMKPEVTLYFSDYCFGTTDAISFSDKEKFLRIHDLKTGTMPAHMEQLLIYVALFCLEYRVKPYEIKTECRIYQNNEIIFHNPVPEEIGPIMDKIVTFDKFLKSVNQEV